jgi:hypothetical protein
LLMEYELLGSVPDAALDGSPDIATGKQPA